MVQYSKLISLLPPPSSLLENENRNYDRQDKEEAESEGAMGKVHCRIGVVLAVPLLGEELVGTAGRAVHL